VAQGESEFTYEFEGRVNAIPQQYVRSTHNDSFQENYYESYPERLRGSLLLFRLPHVFHDGRNGRSHSFWPECDILSDMLRRGLALIYGM
jgi:hypothetical protein